MLKNNLTSTLPVIIKSLLYSAGQLFLGLLLHPYRSVQILVKNKILLPFIFYPGFFVLIFFLSLRLDLLTHFYQQLWPIRLFYQICLFFCFYWQLTLFYLWFRFSRAFTIKNN